MIITPNPLKGALMPANIEISFVSGALPKSPLGDLGVKTKQLKL